MSHLLLRRPRVPRGFVRAAALVISAMSLCACSGVPTRVVQHGSSFETLAAPATKAAAHGALGDAAPLRRVSMKSSAGDDLAGRPLQPLRAPGVESRAVATSAPAQSRRTAAPPAPPPTRAASDAAEVSAAPPSGMPPSGTPPDPDVASIAFQVPPAMTLERRALIRVAMRANAVHAAGAGPVPTPLPAGGDALVEVTLSGRDFLIEPVSASVQRIAPSSTAEWTWLVTPRKTGPRQLHLTVATAAGDGGSAQRMLFPAFQHDVDVGVAWRERVDAALTAHSRSLWIALAVALALLGWRYARWRRRRRRWFHGRL